MLLSIPSAPGEMKNRTSFFSCLLSPAVKCFFRTITCTTHFVLGSIFSTSTMSIYRYLSVDTNMSSLLDIIKSPWVWVCRRLWLQLAGTAVRSVHAHGSSANAISTWSPAKTSPVRSMSEGVKLTHTPYCSGSENVLIVSRSRGSHLIPWLNSKSLSSAS